MKIRKYKNASVRLQNRQKAWEEAKKASPRSSTFTKKPGSLKK